jgi:hypothetical protein
LYVTIDRLDQKAAIALAMPRAPVASNTAPQLAVRCPVFSEGYETFLSMKQVVQKDRNESLKAASKTAYKPMAPISDRFRQNMPISPSEIQLQMATVNILNCLVLRKLPCSN